MLKLAIILPRASARLACGSWGALSWLLPACNAALSSSLLMPPLLSLSRIFSRAELVSLLVELCPRLAGQCSVRHC